MTELISVGVPVYNGEKYIESALASLSAQDAQYFEVIISDNASTDRTREICERFAAKDSRIRYTRNEENIGSAQNFNRVFKLSKGMYFKWAAYDDECHPSMLRKCWEALQTAGPEAVLAYPECELIDDSGVVLQISPDQIAINSRSPSVRLGKVIMQVSTGHPFYGLIRRSALEQTQLLQPVISGDYIMLGELAMLGKIIEVEGALFRYRMHPESSRVKHKTLKDLAVWFDPKNKGKRLWLPEVLALGADHCASVFRMPFGRGQQMVCAFSAISLLTYRRTRNLIGRRKAALKSLVGLGNP
jgi:glycosyltransferase involved in cell wall biosynthesis